MIARTLWQQHGLALVFAALVAVHWVGVYSVTGLDHIFAVSLFAAGVVGTYILATMMLRGAFNRIAAWVFTAGAKVREAKHPLLAGDIFVVAFPVAYFIAAGHVPIVTMYFTDDYMVASVIRHDFFASLPTWLRYAGEYYVKGILPVWLIFSYIDRRPLFPAVFIATAVFSFAIVNKSYIVIVFAPLMIFWLFKRRWLSAALLFGLVGLLLMLSVIVQHKSTLLPPPPGVKLEQPQAVDPLVPEGVGRPSLESGRATAPAPMELSDADPATLLVSFAWKPIEAIWQRAFSAIGVIEAQWLETFPSDYPFAGGCGYSWGAKLAGCEFVNLANLVWEKYYPDLEARGLNGTVTAADYVQAYANFGWPGVLGSALAIGMILVGLNAIFTDLAMRLALNTIPLALTFESVLTTLLNSSGWGLVIALGAVLLARPQPNPASSPPYRA